MSKKRTKFDWSSINETTEFLPADADENTNRDIEAEALARASESYALEFEARTLARAADNRDDRLAHDREREIEIRAREQDIDERKKYANRVFLLVAVWLIVVICILIAHGVKYNGFYLPNAVLIALITTANLGVVGILMVVVRNLFPQHPSNKLQKRRMK